MVEGPEKIWAYETPDGDTGWLCDPTHGQATGSTEYVRVDLVADKADAWDAVATKNARIADLERQIAELRANLDAATDLQNSATRAYAEQCEEIETLVAENARLRALPLKDEVERVVEPFADIAGEAWADENGWTVAACPNDRIRDWFGPSAFRAARTLLSRLRAGEQEGWPF